MIAAPILITMLTIAAGCIFGNEMRRRAASEPATPAADRVLLHDALIGPQEQRNHG